MPTPRILLDHPGSHRLCFESPERVLRAHTPAEVRPLLREVEAAAQAGQWAVGYVSYEAAPAFDAALQVRPGARLPLAWFGLFRAPAEPPRLPDAAGVPALDWQVSATEAEHAAAVSRIRDGIARGDVYQVNHTVRLRARFGGDPLALYERLREAQPGALAAYLDLGEWRILSLSPELFFERAGERVQTRPMKGTRPRGRWLVEDRALAAELRDSVKDRAENLMIVDLLRNDLGRVARTGSVRVPHLYSIEKYRTVWQMTSTIEAHVPRERTLDDIFTALFPCGSITGAPKIAATRFIAALEREPREVYCGAIGVVEPGGDARFSVAIRTLWQDTATGALEYGVGGGITWDSKPRAEWEEALSKAAVLQRDWPASFRLLETMRAEDGACVRLERHVQRLLASAEYFDCAVDPETVRAAVAARVRGTTGPLRVRVLVAADGNVEVQASPLEPLPAGPRPVALASAPVSSRDPFLHHKTTHRAVYDQHVAAHPAAFDVLLHNEYGELTEFTRGNLVLELDGERVTPPRAAGLLPGVFRGALLEAGVLRERTVRPEDLARATGAWLLSSLREWVPVLLPAGTQ